MGNTDWNPLTKNGERLDRSPFYFWKSRFDCGAGLPYPSALETIS
jgi:hypothetical protein